jgi:hypothetical protein
MALTPPKAEVRPAADNDRYGTLLRSGLAPPSSDSGVRLTGRPGIDREWRTGGHGRS